MNKLYIMCGFPGSGKSTYLKGKEIVLGSDAFRYILTGQAWHLPAEDMVWSHMKVCARVLLNRRHDVYIDSINLTVEDRVEWIEIGKEFETKTICVYLDVSFQICLQRNRARNRIVPDDIMYKMAARFVEPDESEGFNELIIRE